MSKLTLKKQYQTYDRYKDSGIDWMGDVPEGWNVLKLKQFANVITGNTPPKSDSENYTKDGTLWIKPNNLDEFHQIYNTTEKISKKGTLTMRIIPARSILVNGIGDIGRIGINGVDCFTNQQINSIILNKKKVDFEFGKYMIYSSSKELQANSNKVVVPILNKTQQKNIGYTFPSLPIQQSIASYLNEKTEKIGKIIENKKRLVGLLEEKRKTIINYAITKGLNKDVEMKNCEVEWVGNIPDSWEIKKLKFLGEAIIGLTYSPDNVVDNGMLVLRSSNVQNNKIKLDDNVFVNKIIPNKLITRIGDILICSRNGSKKLIGKSAVIDKNSQGLTFGAFMAIFRSRHYKFISYYLQSWIFNNQLSSTLTTTVNQLTNRDIKNLIILLPPKDEQQKIVDYLDEQTKKIDNLINKVNQSVNLLIEYKSSLISHVVSGRVKV
ncbi:MAG TPA: restriction endonuclease subunit S [Candidatus Magasanikbacteria bacterium]|nr:restriction endonuclease subunit S [Candidatus Magasanikbacteria bacterium]